MNNYSQYTTMNLKTISIKSLFLKNPEDRVNLDRCRHGKWPDDDTAAPNWL
jgi:hypothetical protein